MRFREGTLLPSRILRAILPTLLEKAGDNHVANRRRTLEHALPITLLSVQTIHPDQLVLRSYRPGEAFEDGMRTNLEKMRSTHPAQRADAIAETDWITSLPSPVLWRGHQTWEYLLARQVRNNGDSRL